MTNSSFPSSSLRNLQNGIMERSQTEASILVTCVQVHCIMGPLGSYADFTFYMYNINEFVLREMGDLLVAIEHTCRCTVYSQQQIHNILKVRALWLEQEAEFAIFFPKNKINGWAELPKSW